MELERYKIQKSFGQNQGVNNTQDSKSSNQLAEVLNRDGELLWLFKDSQRHEKRIQRAVFSEPDKLFWITLAIACGEPNNSGTQKSTNNSVNKKKYGSLNKARYDLDCFYEYYQPIMVGSPDIYSPIEPGLGKSPGFFASTISLDNPTVEELRNAISDLRSWIEVNQEDPEYSSFQFNFLFSGHGFLDEFGNSGIVLSNGEFESYELANEFSLSIPQWEKKPGKCRLDLYLDCCHSAGIAESISRYIINTNVSNTIRSHFELGQIYCSCLDYEESYEFKDLGNSIFSFAFLNECSRKIPNGVDRYNIGLRDIGWFTGGLQHPILFDFSDGFTLKFPANYYINEFYPDSNFISNIVSNLNYTNPVGWILEAIQSNCDLVKKVDERLMNNPDSRKPFNREEIKTNQRFPFI